MSEQAESIDVKAAIKIAKDYVRMLFEDEHLSNLGLEEVSERFSEWEITLGFSRPWDKSRGPSYLHLEETLPPKRTYKVVTVDNQTGKVSSVRNRETT